MNNFTWKRASLITIGIFFIPLIITIICKVISPATIGPLVFIYSVLSLPIFTYLYYNVLKRKTTLPISVFISLLSGITMAVLVLNFFMLVTAIFGVYNYDAM
jgi:hypothetical protein